MKRLLAAVLLSAASLAAQADAVDLVRRFVSETKMGRASFTQTVTAPDGAKKKISSGRFEFLRPDRFRFVYAKPFEQVIVADGRKIWIHDVELSQVTSRKFSQALGATPAALLAGGALDRDFTLSSLPDRDGLAWAQATPKIKEAAFESVRLGFKESELVAVEIIDSFGQRSLLQFTWLRDAKPITAEAFNFTVPSGADLIEQ